MKKKELTEFEKQVKELQKEYGFTTDEKMYKAMGFVVQLLELKEDYLREHKPSLEREYILELNSARNTVFEFNPSSERR